MHLDQLIRLLQHPKNIDPMDAAGKEVVFLDTKGKPLQVGLLTYNQVDDKIYIGVMAAPTTKEKER